MDGLRGAWYRPKNLLFILLILIAWGLMLIKRGCDHVLDWWGFTAVRFISRHRRALFALAATLTVLSAVVTTWAYAAAPSPVMVIIEQQLLLDAIDLIERQQAEIERLRARCHGVAI